MTQPIHRVNAQIFYTTPINEIELYEDVKELYKQLGKISTTIIIEKFNVDLPLALKMMAKVIREV